MQNKVCDKIKTTHSNKAITCKCIYKNTCRLITTNKLSFRILLLEVKWNEINLYWDRDNDVLFRYREQFLRYIERFNVWVTV